MKILQVLDSFFPTVDGPNSVMVNLALKLRELGHEVELLVPDFPKNRVEAEGLKIHRCRSAKSNESYRAALPFFDGKIKRLVKNGGYDVIHLHSPFTLGHFALKTGKKYGIPVVFTFHTKFRDELENRLKSKVLQKFMMNYIMNCINGCTAVTAVSYGAVETLKDYGYKNCGEVKVIYNGTDMPLYGANKSNVADLRQRLEIEDKFAFMFAGRLAEVKNVAFSLKVLAKVKERGINGFKFIIAGDGDYGKTLKKLVSEYNLTENVVFVGRISDKKTLAEYYAACNLLLFPSTFDTFGLVVSEAAANGLPAAVMEGCSSAERLEDGASGFVWKNDADFWAEKTAELIRNPMTAKRAGEGAAEKAYSGWDSIAKVYSELYLSLKNT